MTRKFPIGSLIAVLALLCLSTVSAYADYITGFENPPFTLGALAGQDGWSTLGPGVVTVEGFKVDTGSQAVFVDGGISATAQSGAFHVDTAGPVVDLSADIFLASSSTETGWQFAAVGAGLVGFAGGIDVDPGTNAIHLITAGFPIAGTLIRDQWNQVDIVLDYTTQTYNLFLNGSELGSNLAFCGNNSGPCNGATISSYADGLFDTFGGIQGSNDSGFIDNFSVTSVPEPASLLLLGSVLAVTGWRVRASRAKS